MYRHLPTPVKRASLRNRLLVLVVSRIFVHFARESMVMVWAMRACFGDPSYSTDQEAEKAEWSERRV